MKKLVAIFFTLTLLCIGASAAQAQILGGICGPESSASVRWELNTETGLMRIYGEGPMEDYESDREQPWYNKSIKEVQIEEGITKVGDNAFRYTGVLKMITLPSTLKEIGDNAFNNIYRRDDAKLFTLVIPEGVEKIGDYAFEDVYTDSIVLPSTLKEIGDDAFLRTYITEVALPEGLESIGASAFASTGLREIRIPEGCSVGAGAFADCRQLSSFVLPRSMTVIPDGLFSRTGIDTLTIPDWVTDIGAEAFYDTEITRLELPEGLKTIGKGAFKYCHTLSPVTIPDSVTYIGNDAFYGTYLLGISIGKGVREIGGSAFTNCWFSDIELPEGLVRLGDRAFSNCDELTSVSLPKGLVNMGKEVFYDCNKLESVTLPEKLLAIGEKTFYNCPAIKELKLPESLTSIGPKAFEGTGITRISIPKSVNSIDPLAFYGANRLTAIEVDEANPVYMGRDGVLYDRAANLLFYPNDRPGEKYSILSFTPSIAETAFENCPNLKTLYLLPYLETVDVSIFKGLPNLTDINFYDDAKSYYLSSRDGVLYSGDGNALLYYPSGRLENSFTVPDGVLVIGKDAFAGSSLVRIELPYSVFELGEGAFRDCKRLEEVNIPPQVTVLPKDLFRGCTSLTSFAVPEGVTDINDSFGKTPYALELPQSLTELDYRGGARVLTLPDNLTKLNAGFVLYRKDSVTGQTIGNRMHAIPSIINNGEESTNVGTVRDIGTIRVNGIDIPVYRLYDNRVMNFEYALFVRESDLRRCGYTFVWDQETRTTTVVPPESSAWNNKNWNVFNDWKADERETLTLWSSDIRFVKDGVVLPSINVGNGDSIIELNAIAGMELY